MSGTATASSLHRRRVLASDKMPPIIVDPEGVPASIAELPRWVCWGWKRNSEKAKWDKPPLRPTGTLASSTDPQTWIDFSTAVQTHERCRFGIGFVLNGDGIVGLDLDDCRNPETGELADWAADIVQTMQSYSEVSPSGTGVKLLVRGMLPEHHRSEYPRPDGSKLEVFQSGRYFTITGQRLPGTPDELAERTEQLASVLAIADGWRPRNGTKSHHQHTTPSASPPRGESDRETALAALAVLDPSMSYQEWQRVGMALHSVDSSNAMFQEWDGWSARSDKYVTGECGSKWASFTVGSVGVGLGTLCKLADETGKTWRPARTSPMRQTSPAERPRLAPGTLVRPTDRDNFGTVVEDRGDAISVEFVSPDGQTAVKDFKRSELRHADGRPVDPAAIPKIKFEFIDSSTFSAMNYQQRFLVNRVLVADQPAILGGAQKTLKTSIAVDLAFSLGTGTPSLGEFRVSEIVRVGILSGESGGFTLQETARRIANARGRLLSSAQVWWEFKLPQLGLTAHLEALAEAVEENKLQVMVIDPAYLCMLSTDSGKPINFGNLFEMGAVLSKVSETFSALGCTPIILHLESKGANTFRQKSGFGPPELQDLSMSGFAEWARQWLLIGRREAYEHGSGFHRLWLNADGSAGHGGLWAVDVDEGQLQDDFSGRIWSVSVNTADAARSARDDAKESKQDERSKLKDERDRQRLLEAYAKFPEGETQNTLRSIAKLNGDRFTFINQLLLDEEVVEALEIERKGRVRDGFRLVPTSRTTPDIASGKTQTELFSPEGSTA